MGKRRILFGLMLVFAVPAVGAFASGGIGHARHDDAISFSTTGNAPPARSAEFSLCPTIAETTLVRGKGIDYLRTREFAEAVTAVANGTSSFAPAKLPAEWRGAAYLWKETFTSSEKPRIAVMPWESGPGRRQVTLLLPSGAFAEPTQVGLDGRSCNSDLLFRASLEYRARQGQEDAPLLYPHLVRKAAAGIETRIVAKMESVSRSAKRADDIAVRIVEAGKAGAGECQAKELARAKAELAVARAVITDFDSDPDVSEAVLARAEGASANLLASGRSASIRAMYCGQ